MTQRRNIVLLCLDSVRKDFFDEYAKRLRTRSETSLERCRAASSWSTPSHASMISGKLPSEHGIHTHNRHFQDLPADETVFGDLPDHTKLAVSSNVFAGPAFGFDAYFDAFESIGASNRLPGLNPENYLAGTNITDPKLFLTYLREAYRSDHTLNSLLNAGYGSINLLTSSSSVVPKLFDKGTKPALRRSRDQIRTSDEPFISFCNIMEGHIPHTPIRGYDRRLYPDVPNDWTSDEFGVWELCESDVDEYWHRREQLYSAAIEYLDREISTYVENVGSITECETTVIITSDHGENHGKECEDGMANHVSSLSEGLLHVPFEIINPPPALATTLERLRDTPVSHLQLREMVTAMANGRDVSIDTESPVTRAELIGRAESPDPPSRGRYYDRAQRCSIRNQQKVLWDSQGRVVQYEVDPDSPGWQSEPYQLDSVPAWAAERFATEITEYKTQVQRDEYSVAVDEAVEIRLSELGYMD